VRRSVIIVDNFYEDPEAVRRYALRQRYYYPYEANADVRSGHVRFSWMASWFKEAHECPFKSSSALVEKLEIATGDRIDIKHWRRGFPIDAEGKAAAECTRVQTSCLWNCCFHFKPDSGQGLGDGVHNHVTDIWNSVGENGWAGLIYLSKNAPLAGGLKLWRNRDPKRTFDWMTSSENWELVDDLGNVFNRLILCRGNIPHSGATGWGSNLENGRLYQTFFFRIHEFTPTVGLQVHL
jgi:hypothetical protein